jgi:hypothetical protein
MIENADGTPNFNQDEPITADMAPELEDCLKITNGGEKRKFDNDRAYCKFNMNRRAGKAELAVQTIANELQLLRFSGKCGINWPTESLVIGFGRGASSIFMCIDRICDHGSADFGDGTGIRNGEVYAKLMNRMCVEGGCKGFVVFSIDNWIPGRGYDETVTWYCVPWILARSLGRIDSERTKELAEFIVDVEEKFFDDEVEDEDDDDIDCFDSDAANDENTENEDNGCEQPGLFDDVDSD